MASTGWSGDFGDELSIDEQLVRSRRLAASMFRRDHPDFDDFAQEATIAVWREMAKTPGAGPGLAAVVARNAMYKIAAGRAHFGTADGSHHYRPTTTSMHHADGAINDWILALGARDLLDGVELAYHDGELAHAVNALAPRDREYIVLRFWGGLTDTQIAARLGLSSSKVLWNRWDRYIRPVLVERLAHLAAR